MSNSKASQATVNKSFLKGKKAAEALSTLENVCSAGAMCPEVLNSPIAMHALSLLQQAVSTAHGSLTTRQSLAQALLAAIKALELDLVETRVSLGAYEAAVISVAKGNASVINKAGLPSRDKASPPKPLGKVSQVSTLPGKHPMEAILTWPRAPGATGYAIEVNFTPETPTGPWTGLTPGSGRRRVVKGSTVGAQFLVRVAALGSGGVQTGWSDAVLATAA